MLLGWPRAENGAYPGWEWLWHEGAGPARARRSAGVAAGDTMHSLMAREQSDLELLETWAAGDNRAGGALIKRHFPTLRRFFANKVIESEQADLIQSTMLQCVHAKDGFQKKARFSTFLLSIARHELMHYYRKRGRKLDKLDPLADSVAAVSTSVFGKIANKDEHELLLAALRQLPMDLQIVLELKYWERMTAKECGAILGISANTVSGRIRQGKEKLGALLEQMRQGAVARPADAPDTDQRMEEIREFLGGDPHELLAAGTDDDT